MTDKRKHGRGDRNSRNESKNGQMQAAILAAGVVGKPAKRMTALEVLAGNEAEAIREIRLNGLVGEKSGRQDALFLDLGPLRLRFSVFNDRAWVAVIEAKARHLQRYAGDGKKTYGVRVLFSSWIAYRDFNGEGALELPDQKVVSEDIAYRYKEEGRAEEELARLLEFLPEFYNLAAEEQERASRLGNIASQLAGKMSLTKRARMPEKKEAAPPANGREKKPRIEAQGRRPEKGGEILNPFHALGKTEHFRNFLKKRGDSVRLRFTLEGGDILLHAKRAGDRVTLKLLWADRNYGGLGELSGVVIDHSALFDVYQAARVAGEMFVFPEAGEDRVHALVSLLAKAFSKHKKRPETASADVATKAEAGEEVPPAPPSVGGVMREMEVASPPVDEAGVALPVVAVAE